VSLTAGPACEGRLPHDRDDFHRRFLRDGVVSGQTRHQHDPQTLANRVTPFSPRRSHRKGLAVDHGARRRCSALRRSSQAGRARPRVSYSTSGLRRIFLGRRLGLKWYGMSWPRESRTPAETRRRCASCPATVSAVERPPSGANVR